jgi:hypothetical protein
MMHHPQPATTATSASQTSRKAEGEMRGNFTTKDAVPSATDSNPLSPAAGRPSRWRRANHPALAGISVD